MVINFDYQRTVKQARRIGHTLRLELVFSSDLDVQAGTKKSYARFYMSKTFFAS